MLESIKVSSEKNAYSNETGHNSLDIPEPYQPPETDTSHAPPSYHAYNPHTPVQHPAFDGGAIEFALRASHPPKSSFAADLDHEEREEVEVEQGQYLSSIQYGDQRNRELDELEQFQEDIVRVVGEEMGLTAEDIERRRKLSAWGEERIEEFEVEDWGHVNGLADDDDDGS
jgi:hypothetical protein